MPRASTSTSSKPKKYSRKRESTSKDAFCLDSIGYDFCNDLGILASSHKCAIYRLHMLQVPGSKKASPYKYVYVHCLLPLPFIGLRLMISVPHPEPHLCACPPYLPCRVESVFMKKEMARLKDSAPDLPHRERYVRNCVVLKFLFHHTRRLALWPNELLGTCHVHQCAILSTSLP